MKKLVFSLLSLFVSLVIASVLLCYFALQSQPSIIQPHQISAATAQESQQLARRIVNTIQQQQQNAAITTDQDEINGLTAIFHRAFPMAHLDVSLSDHGASADASVRLPLPEFIRYLNIHAFILPSKAGLKLEQVNIGDISLSGEFFLSMTTWLADTFVQPQLANKMLDMITAIDINQQRVITHLALNSLSADNNNNASVLLKLRDELALFGDVEVIRFYYQSLSEFSAQQSHQSSIAVFVSYLFDLAKTRSMISEDYLAVEENQAALMALVIYFGADRFETLVGDVIIREHQHLVLRNRMRRHVTLQSRVDLQKHFIYSIALQLFSTHYASDALGELKEFLDTNEGGSGFSFADLQADRAGTRLAMIVTKSETHARQAQQLLSKVADGELLPSINGLQEGLDQQAFETKFNHANSTQYQQTISEIDNRLRTLPVYQLGWE